MSRYKTITLFCVFAISVFLCHAEPQRANKTAFKPLHPDYQYPISYRDHTYTSLSQNAQDLFFALNIHPSCLAKKGQCIQRGKCIEKKMLYISRVCYVRDLVCCYVDFEKYPLVEHVTQYPQVPPNLKVWRSLPIVKRDVPEI